MVSIANVSQTDKLVRIVVGAILGAIAFLMFNGIGSTLGVLSLLVAAVLIVTGVFNFCPAYKILGYSTRKKES